MVLGDMMNERRHFDRFLFLYLPAVSNSLCWDCSNLKIKIHDANNQNVVGGPLSQSHKITTQIRRCEG